MILDKQSIREKARSFVGNADVMRCSGCIYRTENKKCINIYVDNPDWYDGGGCSAGKWHVQLPEGDAVLSYEDCWDLFCAGQGCETRETP